MVVDENNGKLYVTNGIHMRSSLEPQLQAETIAILSTEERIREHKNTQIRSKLTLLNSMVWDGEGE